MELIIEKKFNNFHEISDDYLENFTLYKNNKNYNNYNKICYNCEFGSIEFYHYFNKKSENKIIIHEIYVGEQYRNKGLCKNFIKYLIVKIPKEKILIIQSVLSKILYNFLLKFTFMGKKFLLEKEGFVFYI